MLVPPTLEVVEFRGDGSQRLLERHASLVALLPQRVSDLLAETANCFGNVVLNLALRLQHAGHNLREAV